MKGQIIVARVSPKLLTKADRLFTGTIEGRIVEVLQNARRAKTTEVRITNKLNFVTVQDNGCGIQDFQKLLDLGSSGWDEKLEAGEDPAGVGLFSLAPRQTKVLSGYQGIVIDKDGWKGMPVEVIESEEYIPGTKLIFHDEKPWDYDTVEQHAVFTGIRVTVDSKYCHSMPFCSQEASDYPDLGCRIEVTSELSNYHKRWVRYDYSSKVLVNFHGQVVELDYWPGKTRHSLHILVDLKQQTQIRLMLPARTRLVENEALEKLKRVIEIEYYRYFQKQKEHSLYFDEYLRARELGINLPEAYPIYTVGLIRDEYGQAVEISAPEDFQLSDGYLCLNKDVEDLFSQDNVHLLASLGKFTEKPFVPVSIQSGYMGYTWTNLRRVTSVTIKPGKERLRLLIMCKELICVESLSIMVQTTDGNTFESEVPIAITELLSDKNAAWHDEAVYVTQSAKDKLTTNNIWYALDGFNPDGDSYETQQYNLEQALDEFWSELIGPYEHLRHELVTVLNYNNHIYDKWLNIVISKEGTLTIHFKDGKTETVKPPSGSM